jgi:hypothetical protein
MRSAIRAAVTLAAGLALLAACDRPKPRTPKPPPPPIFPTPRPPVAVGPPMPPLPAWSAPLIAQPLDKLFPGEHPLCLGNTDNVAARYGGAAPGVQIVGWGWDREARAPFAQVLLVDPTGVVAGAGESGTPRPDVTSSRPEVTSPNTGWTAYTPLTMGPVDAYGVVAGGKTVCRLGHLRY